MKIAISVPHALFIEVERLARRLRKSRSALFSEAMGEHLARRAPEVIAVAMNKICTAVDSRSDLALSAAVRRLLERSEW